MIILMVKKGCTVAFLYYCCIYSYNYIMATAIYGCEKYNTDYVMGMVESID